jgi:peptide/nickel transport system substrate-binding protein
MVRGKTRRLPGGNPTASAIALSFALSGCGGSGTAKQATEPVILRIGFGLAAVGGGNYGVGQTSLWAAGLQATARNIAFDELVSVPQNGRTLPSLAEGWSASEDGLVLHIRLRPSVTFSNGKPVNAQAVLEVLRVDLPDALGPAFADIAEMRAASELDVEFRLHQRSTFLLEALDSVPIVDPTSKESGTGPFSVQARHNGEIEMRANAGYFGGRPAIDRVILKPYASVRSAWADMLRGQVDMLYEVGVDGLDSLESSNDVNIFPYPRAYAYLLLLNTRTPELRDPAFRRRLNAAIDRRALIDDALRGHGMPAEGPVSPRHWAYTSDLPPFRYQPPSSPPARSPHRLTVLFGEPSLERLAVTIQRQLQAAGVEITLEPVPSEQIGIRLSAGNFDAVLTDFSQGYNLVWPYLYWHSNGPFNFGRYRNQAVDDALDGIRHAANDQAYKAGVAAFWRAIVDDPPAVFLAWPVRTHAVSTRFIVPMDPDTDVLNTLHLWKPAAETERSVHR